MGSRLFAVHELALSPQEAVDLGTASANVLRHYEWTGMAEKTKDWLVFGGCCFMLYGPKLDKIKARRAQARKNKQENQNPTGGVKMAEQPPEEVHYDFSAEPSEAGVSGHFSPTPEASEGDSDLSNL